MSKIFFQSSLPRAGSTLLQNLIGQHPEFYVTPTSGVLEMLYQSRNTFSTSPEFKATSDADRDLKAWRGYCNGAIHGYYDAITTKPYVVDKCRGWGVHYDWLNKFLPYKPKIICMVRDLRSVFASMEKNHRKNPEIQTGAINPSEMIGTTISKRIDSWKAGPLVGLAIDRLQDVISQPSGTEVMFVKYESLFDSPQETMDRIYDYLDVDGHIHDFSNIKQVTHENDVIHGPFGDHNIRPQLVQQKEDYNEILGGDICKWIVEEHQWFYDIFKY